MRLQLHDEKGIALVMALGVMFVISLTLASIIHFTSGNARSANRQNADQQAYALAEAGLNNALSIVSEYYVPSDPTRPTPIFPGDRCLLRPQAPLPAGYPSCGNLPPFTSTLDGRETSYWGMLVNAEPLGWHWAISATGTVANPTGPGAAPVVRRISAKVPVVIPEARNVDVGILNWIFSAKDTVIRNTVNINSPFFALGNLQFDNQADINANVYVSGDLRFKGKGSVMGGPLYVGGRLHLDHNQATIGAAGTPVAEVDLVDGCRKSGALCGATDIYATRLGNSVRPYPVTPPTYNPDTWQFWYLYSAPGPMRACTSSSGGTALPRFDTGDGVINQSAPMFHLTPSVPYSCVVEMGGEKVGELTWKPNASPPTLEVHGTVFIDGSGYASVSGNTPVRYVGQGTLYFSGTFLVKSIKLCAVITGGDCETRAADTQDPPRWNHWDPNKNALIIAANAAAGTGTNTPPTGYSIAVESATFQGVLWATQHVGATSGGTVHGPVISTDGRAELNQSGGATYPAIHFAPVGAPSNPPPPAKLLAPLEFAG